MKETCPTCVTDPRLPSKRYCAPARCYCDHEACPAHPSRAVEPTESKRGVPPLTALEASGPSPVSLRLVRH